MRAGTSPRLACARALIVWDMSNPFLRGGDATGGVVALALSERRSSRSIALGFPLRRIYAHTRAATPAAPHGAQC